MVVDVYDWRFSEHLLVYYISIWVAMHHFLLAGQQIAFIVF